MVDDDDAAAVEREEAELEHRARDLERPHDTRAEAVRVAVRGVAEGRDRARAEAAASATRGHLGAEGRVLEGGREREGAQGARVAGGEGARERGGGCAREAAAQGCEAPVEAEELERGEGGLRREVAAQADVRGDEADERAQHALDALQQRRVVAAHALVRRCQRGGTCAQCVGERTSSCWA